MNEACPDLLEDSANWGDREYRTALVEMLANHMVGEALGADALGPHFHLCPDLESRKTLGLIIEQEAKHGYMLGSLLQDLGEDPDFHFRRLLDRGLPPYHQRMLKETSWTHVVIGSVFLIDPTGIAFMTANQHGNYRPLREVIAAILKEESFHVQFGRQQFRCLSQNAKTRGQCQDAIDIYFPIALRIMGKKDSPRGEKYRRLGLRTEDARTIRNRYLKLVLPHIEAAGLTIPPYDQW